MAMTPKMAKASMLARSSQLRPSSFRRNGVIFEPNYSSLGPVIEQIIGTFSEIHKSRSRPFGGAEAEHFIVRTKGANAYPTPLLKIAFSTRKYLFHTALRN